MDELDNYDKENEEIITEAIGHLRTMNQNIMKEQKLNEWHVKTIKTNITQIVELINLREHYV